MADDPIGLGPRIRAAREKLGLSQQELAARARISVPVLNRLENGQRANPGLETLRALARALRVTMDYLGEMDGGPESPGDRLLAVQSGVDALPALRG
jgi:transcriptional regulator with XRE-family HTH domain